MWVGVRVGRLRAEGVSARLVLERKESESGMASVCSLCSGKKEYHFVVGELTSCFSEAEGNIIWEDCTCFAITAATWFCLQYNSGVPSGVTSVGLSFLGHTCIGTLESKHSARSLCSEDYSVVGQASSHGSAVWQWARIAGFWLEPTAAQWTQAALATILAARVWT